MDLPAGSEKQTPIHQPGRRAGGKKMQGTAFANVLLKDHIAKERGVFGEVR
jgi:hypothetical protein